jgi:hypothetical protein
MDLHKILKDLIAIPSINPMRPNSGEAAERAAIDYLEALLRREQIDCERQMVADGRENLVGCRSCHCRRVRFWWVASELSYRHGPCRRHDNRPI